MGRVTVRVVPRAGRGQVSVVEGTLVVRVRSAPERGKATDEARRTLAAALGVAASRVTLVTGGRSRTKVFDVGGLSEADIEVRLRAT